MRRRFTTIYYIITISINGRNWRSIISYSPCIYTHTEVHAILGIRTYAHNNNDIYIPVLYYIDSRRGRLECSRDDLERRRRDRSPSESRSRAVRLRGLCAAADAANDDGGAMNNNIVLL